MSLLRLVVLLAACVAAAGAQPAPQAPHVPSPPNAVGLELGAGAPLSGHLSQGCAPLAASAAAAGLRRWFRVVVAEAAVSLNRTFDMGECDYVVTAPSGEFYPSRVVAGRDPSAHPFTATTVRAGLEAPLYPTVTRLTAGVGRMWGVGIPFKTLRLTMTGNGARTRFALSVERMWYGLSVEGYETYWDVANAPPPVVVRRERAHQTMVRVGAEVPLGAR